MNRIFAIGDIHGCNEAFQKMLFEKIKIEKTDDIYCIGDYIDRGPDSKGVIDTILQLRKDGFHIYTLRGNHEQMMMDAANDKSELKHWKQNGGDNTLKSFGIKSFNDLSEEYQQFFYDTELYLTQGDYIFVHAGLNFSLQDIYEDKEAMLWERDFESYQPALGKKILVHGHTPESLEYIKTQSGNCINIDGGCVYKNRLGLGNLVALSLPDKQILTIANK
jgi:serine/threonine protein phosphatase 1